MALWWGEIAMSGREGTCGEDAVDSGSSKLTLICQQSFLQEQFNFSLQLPITELFKSYLLAT